MGVASVRADFTQVSRGFQSLIDSIPRASQSTGKIEAETSEKNMKNVMHKITGRMMRETSVKFNHPYHTRVGSDAPYALYETSRPGHDFMFQELHRLENGQLVRTFLSELANMAR